MTTDGTIAPEVGAAVDAASLPDGVRLPGLGGDVVEVASHGGTVSRFEPTARSALERRSGEVQIRLESGASWHRVGDGVEYRVQAGEVAVEVEPAEGAEVFFVTVEPDGSSVIGVLEGVVPLASRDRADLRVGAGEVVLIGPDGGVVEVLAVGADELEADAWVARNRPLDVSLPERIASPPASEPAADGGVPGGGGGAAHLGLPFASDEDTDEVAAVSARRSVQVVGLVGRNRSTRVVRGAIVLVAAALIGLLLFSASRQDDLEGDVTGIAQTVEQPAEPRPTVTVPNTTEAPPITEAPPTTEAPPETVPAEPTTTVAPPETTVRTLLPDLESTSTTAAPPDAPPLLPAPVGFVNERFRAELTQCERGPSTVDVQGFVENRDQDARAYRVVVELRDGADAVVATATADIPSAASGGTTTWAATAALPAEIEISECELAAIEILS